MRISLDLGDKSEWVKVFDPRDSTVFVACAEPPAIGDEVRVDLLVGDQGPKVILRGKVIARRMKGDGTLPRGCSVALGVDEREKVNYLNGYVRGGLLDLRRKRRLPIRLKVTYGGVEGAVESFTRDLNEEGTFIVTEEPLPEDSEIHLFLSTPIAPKPKSLRGVVSHTVVVEDEDVPGMGVRFTFADGDASGMKSIVDELEELFLAGQLPEDCLL